jgi:phage-related protein
MPSIGPRCHELRVRDANRFWGVVYRLDPDVILIAGVFAKTTRATSKHDIADCQQRLRIYDEAARKAKKGVGP